ncbi:ATP-dependent nuclease [Pseudomonas wenzhouensis]|uniref:ATP-dependent nuclease n=1 Tax=Pseudomonas wenzhouensis TaxID=2906062 RepID=UPI003B8453A3
MINSITIENFMRIDNATTIPLGPVTLLVGENGSGKSSILKAVHWSVRCAVLRDPNQKTTLEQMDYTPSRDFLQLPHKKRLQSGESAPRIKVTFSTTNGDTTIGVYSARNDAGTKTSITGPMASSFTADQQLTAYIPGLAGLAETETLLATPVLHRRAASGEGGSVLRHILLGLGLKGNESLEEPAELTDLNHWVGKVFPGTRFWVKFDRLRDIHIEAKFLTPEMKTSKRTLDSQWRPLEMAGTGFLQVVQIFAYLLHFKPKLLLIDEPDSHLHPGTQELLIKAIEEAALKFPDTQFLLTTHSPSLVRASGSVSKVNWISDGKLRQEKEDTIRQRMGWGALDKEIILFTEDGNMKYMKNIVNQWPDLARKVLIWPTFGSSGLQRGGSIIKLKEAMSIGALIHRDRDFMSDSDKIQWEKKMEYDTHKIPLWMPEGSDIESELCKPQHIANVFSIDLHTAESLLDDALKSLNSTEVERDFNSAYQSAIGGLPKESVEFPSKRWKDLGEYGVKTIKGKVLLEAIKATAKKRYEGTSEAAKLSGLSRLAIPSFPIHEDLRALIEAEVKSKKITS